MWDSQSNTDSVLGKVVEWIRRHNQNSFWVESPPSAGEPGNLPRLSLSASYFFGSSFFGASAWLPSVAQPPLPLQEFLPLQPLSPLLHPPLPLHEFMPLQACLSAASLSLSPILIETPGLALDWTACAVMANEPLIKPAIAAPAIIVFLVMLDLSSSCWFLPNFQTAQHRREPGKVLKTI